MHTLLKISFFIKQNHHHDHLHFALQQMKHVKLC